MHKCLPQTGRGNMLARARLGHGTWRRPTERSLGSTAGARPSFPCQASVSPSVKRDCLLLSSGNYSVLPAAVAHLGGGLGVQGRPSTWASGFH